jgi:hypothetical protein
MYDAFELQKTLCNFTLTSANWLIGFIIQQEELLYQYNISRTRSFEAEAHLNNYLRIQSVPQRKHNTSPLQRSTG